MTNPRAQSLVVSGGERGASVMLLELLVWKPLVTFSPGTQLLARGEDVPGAGKGTDGPGRACPQAPESEEGKEQTPQHDASPVHGRVAGMTAR